MSDPAENRDVRGNTIKPHSVEAESVNTERTNGIYFIDGSESDAEFQSLLNSGGLIFIQEGQHNFTGPFTLPSNVAIIGVGREGQPTRVNQTDGFSELTNAATDGSVFFDLQGQNGDDRTENVIFANIEISGNENSGDGIVGDFTRYCRFINIGVKDHGGIGINIGTTGASVTEDTTSSNLYSDVWCRKNYGDWQMRLDHDGNSTIEKLASWGYGSEPGGGLLLKDPRGTYIEDSFWGAGLDDNQISITAPERFSPDVRIRDSLFESGQSGTESPALEVNAEANTASGSISGCAVYSRAETGIAFVNGARGWSVSDCSFYGDAGSIGIDIRSGATRANRDITIRDIPAQSNVDTLISDNAENVSVFNTASYQTKVGGLVNFSGDGSTTTFTANGLASELADASARFDLSARVTPTSAPAINNGPIIAYMSDTDGDGDFTDLRVKFASAPPSGTDNISLNYVIENTDQR